MIQGFESPGNCLLTGQCRGGGTGVGSIGVDWAGEGVCGGGCSGLWLRELSAHGPRMDMCNENSECL